MSVQIATACPDCLAQIPVEADLLLGEILQCPDCGLELEVVSLVPTELAPAPEIEEDWGE